MNLPIQCLNILILIATLNPALIFQIIIGSNKSDYGFNTKRFLFEINVFYLILLLIIYILNSNLFIYNVEKNWIIIVISIIAIPILIIFEILISYLITSLKQVSFKKLNIEFIGTSNNLPEILGTVFVAFFEEITYRIIWFNILLNTFQISLLSTLIITTIVYAFNHYLMGINIFITKIVTGLIFGIVLIYTNSIIPVLILHMGENLLMSLFSMWRKKYA